MRHCSIAVCCSGHNPSQLHSLCNAVSVNTAVWSFIIHTELSTEEEEDDDECNVFSSMLPVQVSGREVFEFRPELVNDDDEEADDTKYTNVDDEFIEEVTSYVHLHDHSVIYHCTLCPVYT